MFITFEGGEGSGKTTQIRLLAEYLRGLGYEVVLTKEPGGCPIADKIRAILLDAESKEMDWVTELLLFSASRSQHVAEVIKPALKAGFVVLCDRYADSSFAYQVEGRGLSNEVFQQLTQIATGGLKPEVTFLLDIPVEVGINRALARMADCTKEARFEQEMTAFHTKVHAGFKKLVEQEPERFRVINANRGIDEIQAELKAAVINLLEGRKP